MYTVWSYIVYLITSLLITAWVGRTLYRRGRMFPVDAFRGNEAVADSVNHLLVVGFYLINIGYVTLALKYGDKPSGMQQSIEFLSTKVGLVLVILGAMHFINVLSFAKLRTRSQRADVPREQPVVRPTGRVN